MISPLPAILREILTTAEQRAKGFCTSRQLRKGIGQVITELMPERVRGFLSVPHYWAYYYHVGRRNLPPIRPVGASVLVWFKDPNKDPRLNNGQSPIYRSQIKQLNLSAAEFKRLRKNGDLIIAKRSPRSGGASFEGNPFFSDKPGGGLAGIENSLTAISERETRKAVESWLRSSGLKKKTIVHHI